MSFWEKQRVVVTGGAGFLGSFVCEKLQVSGSKLAKRFNEYFYGPRDYAIVGWKP